VLIYFSLRLACMDQKEDRELLYGKILL